MARKETDTRVTATLDRDLYGKLAYAAEKRGISLSECLRDAVRLLVRYENEDYYPLAKLEAERINQLVAGFKTLSAEIRDLRGTVVEGVTSLLGVANGNGNYLFDGSAGGTAGT